MTTENNNKSAEEKEITGTDVLNDNVSRETLPQNSIYEKQKKKKADLDKVREKGNIADDNPFDFNNPSLRELYDSFRKSDLTRLESGFNALYLWCYDNYYSSGVPIKEKYKNIYAHPSSWFKNTHDMWKHNKWSVAVRLLEIIPAISRTAEKLKEKRKRFRDNFWKTFEYSHKSATKALRFAAYLFLIAATVTIFAVWSNGSSNNFGTVPALKLYVDGEYIGDVLSMYDAEAAKDSVEKSLSVNLGSTYNLDCTMEYKATKIKDGSNLTPARLSRAFGDVAHKEMQNGYGLYVYDMLVAVSPERAWLDESINESLEMKLTAKQRDNSEKVSYSNFVVKQGSYPEKFFSTKQEIRELFSLPETPGEKAVEHNDDADYLNISEKTTLLTGKNAAGTSSDVSAHTEHTLQIAIETVITKRETRLETIPYGTVYNYTDELPENRRVVTKNGKNGSKQATYIIEYGENNREISRRLLNEVVISEPQSQVVSQGTRPLTEEEKRTASTGTYIYPSSGEISSDYSWRTMGGYNEFHKGIDIRSDKGLVLVASDGGVVIQAHDREDGYGKCILIEHDDGTITRYAHCAELYVEEGQRVAQGDYIADMGATGRVTGVHIHFEMIKDGKTVDPMNYLPPR